MIFFLVELIVRIATAKIDKKRMAINKTKKERDGMI